MADDTPALLDSGHNATITSPYSTPSAPSEFLTHLPPSDARAFDDAAEELAAEDAVGSGSRPASSTANDHLEGQRRKHTTRSCMHCRQRKTKCDRPYPCSHCRKARIECVLPAPGRARRSRKIAETRNPELLARLNKLEALVKGMGVEIPSGDKGTIGTHGDEEVRHNADNKDTLEDVDSKAEADQGSAETPGSSMLFPSQNAKAVSEQWLPNRFSTLENGSSQLLMRTEGKSRYINNSFWASLNNEVDDLQDAVNQPSDDEQNDQQPPSSIVTSKEQAWIFGFSSQKIQLLPLHPARRRVPAYWETFKDRVDPVVKVLHIPTLEPTILKAALNDLPKALEVLLFAIYYGAVTSLKAADCLARFGEEKEVLLVRYRFALEQALARADFLTTEEIMVLQGFVIFLVCLKRNGDARVIWTLTGHAARIAQAIGLHRDGLNFGGLSPFEVEMRRRLWWRVCILDIRASEDHGCDPTVIRQAFDTRFPLNVSDLDIDPDMTAWPHERQGCTEMSHCCILYEVAILFSRLHPTCDLRDYGEPVTPASLQDKEQWITECHQRIEERYLKHCDMTVPLYWVTATAARLIMSKMWLTVYHTYLRQNGKLPLEARNKLFVACLQTVEYSLLLETESKSLKWGWFFRTYMQWQALAFMLSELCHRLSGDLVERAWTAVEKTRDDRWGDRYQAENLWRPLRKLYRKAREAREEALQKNDVEESSAWDPAHNKCPTTVVSVPPEQIKDGMESGTKIVSSQAPLPQDPLDANFLAVEGPLSASTFTPIDRGNRLGHASTSNSTGTVDSSFSDPFPSSDMEMSVVDDELGFVDWDQLVREFGMDVDFEPSMPGAGNMKVGMGMGAGNWF